MESAPPDSSELIEEDEALQAEFVRFINTTVNMIKDIRLKCFPLPSTGADGVIRQALSVLHDIIRQLEFFRPQVKARVNDLNNIMASLPKLTNRVFDDDLVAAIKIWRGLLPPFSASCMAEKCAFDQLSEYYKNLLLKVFLHGFERDRNSDLNIALEPALKRIDFLLNDICARFAWYNDVLAAQHEELVRATGRLKFCSDATKSKFHDLACALEASEIIYNGKKVEDAPSWFIPEYHLGSSSTHRSPSPCGPPVPPKDIQPSPTPAPRATRHQRAKPGAITIPYSLGMIPPPISLDHFLDSPSSEVTMTPARFLTLSAVYESPEEDMPDGGLGQSGSASNLDTLEPARVKEGPLYHDPDDESTAPDPNAPRTIESRSKALGLLEGTKPTVNFDGDPYGGSDDANRGAILAAIPDEPIIRGSDNGESVSRQPKTDTEMLDLDPNAPDHLQSSELIWTQADADVVATAQTSVNLWESTEAVPVHANTDIDANVESLDDPFRPQTPDTMSNTPRELGSVPPVIDNRQPVLPRIEMRNGFYSKDNIEPSPGWFDAARHKSSLPTTPVQQAWPTPPSLGFRFLPRTASHTGSPEDGDWPRTPNAINYKLAYIDFPDESYQMGGFDSPRSVTNPSDGPINPLVHNKLQRIASAPAIALKKHNGSLARLRAATGLAAFAKDHTTTPKTAISIAEDEWNTPIGARGSGVWLSGRSLSPSPVKRSGEKSPKSFRNWSGESSSRELSGESSSRKLSGETMGSSSTTPSPDKDKEGSKRARFAALMGRTSRTPSAHKPGPLEEAKNKGLIRVVPMSLEGVLPGQTLLDVQTHGSVYE